MTEVDKRLTALWVEILKCGTVTEDTDFFECGGNSIAAVYLAAMVQEELRISLDAIEVITSPKFGQLRALVKSRWEETSLSAGEGR